MPFSERIKVMLYSRSGNKCAFPNCSTKLVFKLEDATEVVNFGEAAHIIGESEDGPRGQNPLPIVERNTYKNGLVLCSPHHKVIDDYPETYTVEMLQEWKHLREAATDAATFLSSTDAQYAEIVDRWSEGSHLALWARWSQNVLLEGGQSIEESVQQDLQNVGIWLASRVWPGTYPKLEEAFNNFHEILNDFMRVFALHWTPFGQFLRTEKFYKSYYKSSRLVVMEKTKEYEFHTRLLDDLLLELTRGANLICDRVREYVDANFRTGEGKLLVRSGEYSDGSWLIHVPEYKATERELAHPYPGLDTFMQARATRDFVFGSGSIPNYIAQHYVDEEG